MEILEDRRGWLRKFQEGWLAHYQETGEEDWSRYNRPTNKEIPAGQGLEPSESRLLLISTAGGYLEGEQEPFDAEDPYGDYSVRTFAHSTPLDRIAFAHDHYDHGAVDQDPEVLLPMRHLEELARGGEIGELAESVISLMGYQPYATRTVDETIPAVVSKAKGLEAEAALLVPA